MFASVRGTAAWRRRVAPPRGAAAWRRVALHGAAWRPYLLHVSGGAGGAEPGVATPLRRLAEGRVEAEQVVAELALITPTIIAGTGHTYNNSWHWSHLQ